jgi:hypothetical protein
MSSRPCAVWQWRSSALLPWAVYLARYITRSYCKEVGECLRVLYPCRNQVDTSYSFNWCALQIDQLQPCAYIFSNHGYKYIFFRCQLPA